MEENFKAQNLEVFFTAEEIAGRVKELADSISKDYAGKKLTVVGVLNGSFIFMADLVREISIPVCCDFLSLSSYGSGTKSSGKINMNMDLKNPVEGKHVLLIEDIVDSGLTLEFLQNHFKKKKAASVRFCSLIKKVDAAKKSLEIDYLGFPIKGDDFLVGYGLDHDENNRALPFIAKK